MPDGDGACIKINAIPFQAYHLAAPQPVEARRDYREFQRVAPKEPEKFFGLFSRSLSVRCGSLQDDAFPGQHGTGECIPVPDEVGQAMGMAAAMQQTGAARNGVIIYF